MITFNKCIVTINIIVIDLAFYFPLHHIMKLFIVFTVQAASE